MRKLGKEWLEIAGCGMVHPKVFENVGYDPEVWSGWAFGFGIERIDPLGHDLDIGVGLFEARHQSGRRGGGVVEMEPPAHGHWRLGVWHGQRCGGKRCSAGKQGSAFHGIPPGFGLFYFWCRKEPL